MAGATKAAKAARARKAATAAKAGATPAALRKESKRRRLAEPVEEEDGPEEDDDASDGDGAMMDDDVEEDEDEAAAADDAPRGRAGRKAPRKEPDPADLDDSRLEAAVFGDVLGSTADLFAKRAAAAADEALPSQAGTPGQGAIEGALQMATANIHPLG